MSKKDYSVIDEKNWTPILSPGLRSAKHQLAYDSPEVQQVLAEAFSTMFPSIVEGPNNQKCYQCVNSSGTDIFGRAVPAKNLSDIPRAEMMRLMEGWIRLRRKLQDESHPNNVTAILLNLRVPNPRQSLDRYMIYKRGEDTRLMIRWGYETQDAKAVSLERAISILMDVPLGHMRSILSTTMTQTTSTVPVGPMLAAAEAREKQEKAQGNAQRRFNMIMAASVAVIAMVGGAYALTANKEKAPVATLGAVPELAEELVDKNPEVEQEEDAFVFEPSEETEELKPLKLAAVEEAKVLAEPKPEPQATMSSMMDDLVGGASKPKAEQALNLDSMIGAETTVKVEGEDLLGEMLR